MVVDIRLEAAHRYREAAAGIDQQYHHYHVPTGDAEAVCDLLDTVVVCCFSLGASSS